MDEQNDTLYMTQAFELAEQGRGLTSPNPMVGALVVKDGQIVGRGFHRQAGGDHAEVIALREAGERARGATLYVTLEPCCHHGKTPPCTDKIIASGVTRVVAALADPNPLVCGQGVACLSCTGIDVEVGLMADYAEHQNEAFLKHMRTGIPFVTLKLAASLDGRIAARDGTSKWITGPDSRHRVHKMRAWTDVVMVGAGTVAKDNPSLTVRDIEGRDPLRVIVDGNAVTRSTAAVVKEHTIICVNDTADPVQIASYEERGAEVWIFQGDNGIFPLRKLMVRLGERSITSVLCEGGASIASTLIREQLVDKLVYMIAPKLLGSGTDAFGYLGIGTIANALELSQVDYEKLGDDIIITGYPRYETK